jgi:Cft2 family RNA processing exonuclease
MSEDNELMISAIPSGNAIGASVLKIEFNKLQLFYAIDLNDKIQQLTPAMQQEKFQNACVLFTNGFKSFNQEGKQYHSVIEERIRAKLEKVLLE